MHLSTFVTSVLLLALPAVGLPLQTDTKQTCPPGERCLGSWINPRGVIEERDNGQVESKAFNVRSIDDTAISNATTTLPVLPRALPCDAVDGCGSWVCPSGRICERKVQVIESGQTHKTASAASESA